MSIISQGPNNQLAVSGSIISVSANGFSIEGGSSIGYFNVTTTSTTTSSFTPAVGEFVEASGTGSPGTGLAASSLLLLSLPSAPITLSGQVSGMTTGGFVLQADGKATDVYPIYSTTYAGSKPYVGEYLSVAGLGSEGSSEVAKSVTQIAAPTPGSSASPPPVPTPTAGATPTPTPSNGPSIAIPSGVLTVSGQIVSATSSRVAIQTGASCGYMYIYLNSGTAYFDGPPLAGAYGTFTGTGTKCGSLTAATVSVASAPLSTVTVTGTVSATAPYGFALATSAGTSVPVALSSSTVVFGGTLAVGASVTVTALGSPSEGLTASVVAVSAPTPAPAASPTATPGPISMLHVMSAAMVYGYAGTPTTVPIGSIAPWVTWAQTSESSAPTLRANGIKVDVYSNFWRNYTTDNPSVGYVDLEPGGAHAAAEAKDCSGNVIYDSTYGGGYLADPRTTAALGHAQTVVNYDLGEFAGNYDALFSDDSAAVGGVTAPCGYLQSAYDSAVNTVHSALGVPIWINALGAAQDPVVAASDLVSPVNVLGAMCEECYSNNPSGGDVVTLGPTWVSFENAEIRTVAQHKVFWDLPTASRDASSETAIRIYQYASFLLSYDPAYAMLQEEFSTPSALRIFPEIGLVAENPTTTQSDVSGYQAAGGAYMREFGGCYYRGNFVGRCAVVVNPNSASVPVPTTSYLHSMQLSGGGVLDGGVASFNAAAPTTLAQGTATILFP